MKANAKPAAADVLVSGYAMQGSGPEVNAADVELAHVASLEVGISWGDNVLHVEHLTPPRAFVLGEGGDFVVASGSLAASTMPLVVVEGGVPAVVLPPGATGWIETVGAMPRAIADVVAAGGARAYFDPDGILRDARALDLPAGSQATVKYAGSDLTFRVASVCAGRPVPVDVFTPGSSDAMKFVAASFVAHASMLAAMAFFMPGLGATDAESLDSSNVLLMQKLLSTSAERELQQEQATNTGSSDGPSAPAPQGSDGSRARDTEGKMGSKSASATPARYALMKTSDADPQLAHEVAMQEAKDFGFAGLLASMSPNAPSAPWASHANGSDASDAIGNLMFSDSIDDALGDFGLRSEGVGPGGGGTGNFLALDGVAGLRVGGKLWANCTGAHCGNGGPGGNDGTPNSSGTPPLRPHVPKVTAPRRPETTGGGHIDREVIQRIVRMNFGRFRGCYEDGLRTNPSLRGRVEVKFVIGRDGSVMTAQDGDSDLPDAKVVQCVVRNFGPLSFPQPEGGTVGVTYPLVFSPSD